MSTGTNNGELKSQPSLSELLGMDFKGMLADINRMQSEINQQLQSVGINDNTQFTDGTTIISPPEPRNNDLQYRPRGYTYKDLRKLPFRKLFELSAALEVLQQRQISSGLSTLATRFSIDSVNFVITNY